jgi:hypothetical protein
MHLARLRNREQEPMTAAQAQQEAAQNTAPVLVAENRRLPNMASSVLLIALLGVASLGFAFVALKLLMR